MPPRTIIFDLFHTLVDPEDFRPKNFRRVERVASLLGVNEDSFSSYWSETLSLRITSNSTTPIRLVEEFLTRNGLACDQAVLAKVDHELGRFQDEALLKPHPEIVSALRSLSNQGFKLGLLTNCDAREVREWPNSPLSPFFQTVCFSFEIGVEKPALKAYQTVLERLGCSAREALYVGDGGNNELEGAKAAGFALTVFMAEFVARNGLRKPTEIQQLRNIADLSIDSLDALIPLLDSRRRQETKA